MKVILASKNQHKLTELSAILSGLGFEIALESEYGLDIDVDETGTTFEENSLLKAEAVMKASGLPVLAVHPEPRQAQYPGRILQQLTAHAPSPRFVADEQHLDLRGRYA